MCGATHSSIEEHRPLASSLATDSCSLFASSSLQSIGPVSDQLFFVPLITFTKLRISLFAAVEKFRTRQEHFENKTNSSPQKLCISQKIKLTRSDFIRINVFQCIFICLLVA